MAPPDVTAAPGVSHTASPGCISMARGSSWQRAELQSGSVTAGLLLAGRIPGGIVPVLPGGIAGSSSPPSPGMAGVSRGAGGGSAVLGTAPDPAPDQDPPCDFHLLFSHCCCVSSILGPRKASTVPHRDTVGGQISSLVTSKVTPCLGSDGKSW